MSSVVGGFRLFRFVLTDFGSEKEKRAEEFNENDRNDEENDGEKFNREKPLDEREIRKNRTWHEALKRSPDCGNTVLSVM